MHIEHGKVGVRRMKIFVKKKIVGRVVIWLGCKSGCAGGILVNFLLKSKESQGLGQCALISTLSQAIAPNSLPQSPPSLGSLVDFDSPGAPKPLEGVPRLNTFSNFLTPSQNPLKEPFPLAPLRAFAAFVL